MMLNYRILDLTDEKGFLCGKVLADLGADVIKIEPPGGDPARRIGPFYKDIPHPEKSLFWLAYNTNKRGITLNLETEDGKDIFRRLVKTSDVIIESFPPGYMKSLGLGYEELSQIKSDIILTSITPFGQEGPYKDYKASDLICWSMGGFAYLTGDPDRPPVQVSFPQAYLNGALEGAVATMLALYHREITGEGQWVDVSIQASVAKDLMNAPLFYQFEGKNLSRAGAFRTGLTLATGQRVIWRCKDGYVAFFFWGGLTGAKTNRSLVRYMDEEGKAPQFMIEMDWENFDISTAPVDLFQNLSHFTCEFFLSHTKEELFKEAVKRRMTLYPLQTVADILADPQLKERDFWENIEDPQLNASLLYPRLPFKSSEPFAKKWRRAPLIGEHNEEIYIGELGILREDLIRLKSLGVI